MGVMMFDTQRPGVEWVMILEACFYYDCVVRITGGEMESLGKGDRWFCEIRWMAHQVWFRLRNRARGYPIDGILCRFLVGSRFTVCLCSVLRFLLSCVAFATSFLTHHTRRTEHVLLFTRARERERVGRLYLMGFRRLHGRLAGVDLANGVGNALIFRSVIHLPSQFPPTYLPYSLYNRFNQQSPPDTAPCGTDPHALLCL